MTARTKPSRVLFVEANDDRTVGGSHYSMFDLVRLLDRARFDPVVCFYRDNSFSERFHALGIPVELVEGHRHRELELRRQGGRIRILTDSIRGIAWRLRMIRELGIDLVHINNSPLQGADDWLPAAMIAGVPIVSMLRGDAMLEHPRIRMMANRFNRIVAVSRYMADDAIRSGLDASRLEVVHNGIDLSALRDSTQSTRVETRQALGAAADAIIVLLVGNIREWKGQHVALEALAGLPKEERQRCLLLFAGEASEHDLAYQARLTEFIASAGLAAQVRFLGFRSDVADLLAAADIALHASTAPEPFGRVLVEAMALGAPLVASRLGGPSEVVTPDSGVLFDPAVPATLTAVLSRLIRDPAERARLGAGGAKRAAEFDVRSMVDGVSRVYDEVIAARRRR